MAVKARPVPPPVAVYNWTGFYVGINGGGGSAHKCWDLINNLGVAVVPAVAEGCHNATGGTIGGQIGYRWQASNWVFGLEAQGNWADFTGSNPSLFFVDLTDRSKVEAFGLFTGQIGYAVNNVLLYVKGGAAVISDKYNTFITSTGVGIDSGRETRWGGVVGAGVEFGFAPNWSVALSTTTCSWGPATSAATTSPPAPSRRLIASARMSTSAWSASTIASAARSSPSTDRQLLPDQRKSPGLVRGSSIWGAPDTPQEPPASIECTCSGARQGRPGARGDALQPRDRVDEAHRQRRPERLATGLQRGADDVVLDHDLHGLGHPHRKFPTPPHRIQFVFGGAAAGEPGGQQVRGRDRVLHREVDPDAADRRHRVRRVADQRQPSGTSAAAG